jgi:hypothetical protein
MAVPVACAGSCRRRDACVLSGAEVRLAPTTVWTALRAHSRGTPIGLLNVAEYDRASSSTVRIWPGFALGVRAF